jgi:hypothetical protein
VNEPSILPTLASVVFARITEFARRPVAEQARLRAQLESALAVSMTGMPIENRIILDAPDGIAVAVLRDPPGALDVAERWLTSTAAGVPVAIAINHGAIRLAPDGGDHQGLIGDAIGTAAAIAHFAGAARLFVSRTFRDALAEMDPGRATCLKPAGVFTDANVRTHELLAPAPGARSRRRNIMAAVGVTLIFGIGAALVLFHQDLRREFHAGKPAMLSFDIRPHGDVFVDGIYRGPSPPLSQLRLAPGPHAIEVRRKNYPSLKTSLDLEAGRSETFGHSFEPENDPDLLDRIREALGL